jgi:hypothetical protein
VIADEREPRTARLLERSTLTRQYLPGGRWVVEFDAEARLWSYGAVVGALARAAEAGCCGLDDADGFATRLQHMRMGSPDGRMAYRADDARAFPRHESHVFEGLAAFASASSASVAMHRHGWRLAGGVASIGAASPDPTGEAQ